MIVLIPLLWLVAWLVVSGLVAAFSGLAPHGAGLTLFLVLFLGGGFGLPLLGGALWYLRGLRRRRSG